MMQSDADLLEELDWALYYAQNMRDGELSELTLKLAMREAVRQIASIDRHWDNLKKEHRGT